MLVRYGLFSLLSMSALAWPLLRGVSWRQVRLDLGTSAGREHPGYDHQTLHSSVDSRHRSFQFLIMIIHYQNNPIPGGHPGRL